VSTQRANDQGRSHPPTREELLARGRPFPAYEEMMIEGLTDDEERAFLAAIADA
jgi:hypothetical protein